MAASPLSTHHAPLNFFQACLTVLDKRVLSCSVGHYPWDDWERTRWRRACSKELAGLGRLTVREAYQHGWNDRLEIPLRLV